MQKFCLAASLGLFCCLPGWTQTANQTEVAYPLEQIEDTYETEFQVVEEIRRLVKSLVPELTLTPDPEDPSTLLLRGSPEDVEAGMALLEQLDRPPDQICYDFRVVSLGPSAFRELQVVWNADHRLGTAHGPCNGGPYSTLNYLSRCGLASVLSSPRLTGTSGKQCLQSLPEWGLGIQLMGQIERRGRLRLSVALERYNCELSVSDGQVLILRGIAPSPEPSREIVLMICPMMMY